MKIELEVSEENESTDSPYWLILDPRQNMCTDIYTLARQITGPFFSREEAQQHLDARHYNFSKKAQVFCASGWWSKQYRTAYRKAKELQALK